MEAETGTAAGLIWRYLRQHGATTLAKLKNGTKLADQPLLMGLGWLAREGKLTLVREGRSLQISLRDADR